MDTTASGQAHGFHNPDAWPWLHTSSFSMCIHKIDILFGQDECLWHNIKGLGGAGAMLSIRKLCQGHVTAQMPLKKVFPCQLTRIGEVIDTLEGEE